jgi:hypothetical protein
MCPTVGSYDHPETNPCVQRFGMHYLNRAGMFGPGGKRKGIADGYLAGSPL